MGTSPGAGSASTGEARRHRAFFDDDYYRVLEPFHTEAETRREVGAIRELLGLSLQDAVLDLGCGWGRHLRLLHRAGHDLVGIDLSLPLLRRLRVDGADGRDGPGAETPARTTPAARRGRRPRVVAGDMTGLPFAAASFDVVLNLATSLGLFLDDAPALAALREARRVLRPGGRLLLEGMHREDVVAAYAERDAWTLADGTVVRARRRLDRAAGISHEVLRWTGADGRRRSKRHSLRLRSADELAALVEKAGFDRVGPRGGWDGEPFHADSPRLIIVARAGPPGRSGAITAARRAPRDQRVQGGARHPGLLTFPAPTHDKGVERMAERKIRVLVAKPGLDGHDRGAKVMASALRDAGFEVIYTGLHQTPEMVVNAAVQEDVDVVALSILSGAHMTLFPKVLELLREEGMDHVLLTGGGIIPEEDMEALHEQGVGRLFGPGTPTNEPIDYIRSWFEEQQAAGRV